MYRVYYPLLALCCLVTGCTALTSEIDDGGVVYHLPKTILNIAVTQFEDTQTGRVWYQFGSFTEQKKAGETDVIESVRKSEITSVSVPDPLHRYVLHYQPSAMSDDRLCISRSRQGLLQDVEFAADDQTPEVVFNIARFLAGSLGGEAKTSAPFIEPAGANGIKKRTYASQIDPFSSEDIAAYNANMARIFGRQVKLDFSALETMLRTQAATLPTGCSLKDKHCSPKVWQTKCTPENICYRTKMKVPVYLEIDGRATDVDYAEVVNLVDMGAISVKRAFLVHTITRLRFDEGSLVGATIRKPSEVEEASLLPLHVVNAALITPSGLWATAFADNTQQQNQEFAGQLKKLKDKVVALNTSYQNINQNYFGDPDLTEEQKESNIYKPTCHVGRGNKTFNLVDLKLIPPPSD